MALHAIHAFITDREFSPTSLVPISTETIGCGLCRRPLSSTDIAVSLVSSKTDLAHRSWVPLFRERRIIISP